MFSNEFFMYNFQSVPQRSVVWFNFGIKVKKRKNRIKKTNINLIIENKHDKTKVLNWMDQVNRNKDLTET